MKIAIRQPPRRQPPQIATEPSSFPVGLVLLGVGGAVLILAVTVIGVLWMIRPESVSAPPRSERPSDLAGDESRLSAGYSDLVKELISQEPNGFLDMADDSSSTLAADDGVTDEGTIESALPEQSTLPEHDEQAIRIAVEFIRHAQLRDTPGALGLIDRQLFQRRMLGPDGSREAITFGLNAEQVLSRLSQYSLEGTGKSGGRRHWQILRPSTYGGLPAILVRYYSEAESASSALIAIKKDHQLVADLFPWEEFEPYAAVLSCYQQFPKIRSENGIRIGPRNGYLATRFGNALLVFDKGADGETRLCDIVDVMAEAPLSARAGLCFNRTSRFPPMPPRPSATDPVVWCLLGRVPREFATEVAVLRAGGFATAEESWDELADLADDHLQLRVARLAQIRVAMRDDPQSVNELVEQFRRDFEFDFGADLTVLSYVLAPDQVGAATQIAANYVAKFDAERADAVLGSADFLYGLTEDPFLLAVQANVARAVDGDSENALRIYREAQAQGYESVEMFQLLLSDAIRSGQKTRIENALSELSDYWRAFPLSKSGSQYQRLASMWEFHRLQNMSADELAALIPEPDTSDLGPSIEEMMKESDEQMKRMRERMDKMMDDMQRQSTKAIRDLKVPRFGR